jgi:DNA gyrase/topoisomerase IV subunit A
LEATKAQVMDLMDVVERNKAAVNEKTDLLDSQSREMDRLVSPQSNSGLGIYGLSDKPEWATNTTLQNMKARRLNDAIAALEEEKEQLETELRDRATTIAMLRSRLTELELQLSKKQRDDEDAGETSKSDLVERNTLLLTILQHLESILGDDGRPDGIVIPKPSINFAYFSNHLLSRLKSLSGLFVLFERKAKELEDKTLTKLM